MVALALAIAFICSAAAELFGLAFIIGAYSVGLGLSRTSLARRLTEELNAIGNFFVPIFFAALGMLVNPAAMFSSWQVVAFGLAITAAAILGKVIGCGAAALPVGFNLRGAYRIGIGMMPRGEVALIVAGVGLAQKRIGETVFGVSIMMTLVTTVLAPILLVPAFAGGATGRRRRAAAGAEPQRDGGEGLLPTTSVMPAFEVHLPPALCRVFVERLLALAEAGAWQSSYDAGEGDLYLLRNKQDAAFVRMRRGTVVVDSSGFRQAEFVEFARAARRSIAEDADRIEVTVRESPAASEDLAAPHHRPFP